jgi:osmotically-inducible protein OsmY
MGATMVYTDRRTSAVQVEDQAIEFKASSRVRDTIGDRGRVTVTSYNRVALITGEVPSDADRTSVEQTVARVDGVHRTFNERRGAGNTGSPWAWSGTTNRMPVTDRPGALG